MKKMMAMMGVALLLLASCGPSAAPANLATKAEEITGTWYQTWHYEGKDWYLRIKPDGTFFYLRAPEVSDENATASGNFYFEGTEWHMTATKSNPHSTLSGRLVCFEAGQESATFQIQLLANGNLKFVVVDVPCKDLIDLLALGVWEPVR